MTRTEDALRAALKADADQITSDDLRPLSTFPPMSPRRSGRWVTGAVVLTAAAATVAVALGTNLFAAPVTRPTASPQMPAAAEPLPVTINVTARTTITPSGARLIAPVARVHAADPRTAQHIGDAIDQHLADMATWFSNRIADRVSGGNDPKKMSDRIAIADTATWNRYLSVRFDNDTDLGDPELIRETSVLIFDTRTGDRVGLGELFTDLNRVAGIARGALAASGPDGKVRASDLAAISLKPAEDGSTPFLTCYPAAAGLHCLVDNGIVPDIANRLETIISWERLTAELRPGFGV